LSAKHALLGLLIEGPAYPYLLADRLEARLGPAWSVDESQLYKTIGQMEKEGLIEPVGGKTKGQDKRRRFFAITEGGEREFEDWLELVSGAVRLHRRPQLLKITLAGPKRLSTALEQIDAYEQSCTRRLNEFVEVREQIPRQQTPVRADHVLLRLNLGIDIALLEGELQRARGTRETLLWLHAQPEAIWPATAEPSRTHNPLGRRGAREDLCEGIAAKRRRQQQPKREELGQR
jgi:DNA-binding PadR family transcriptional regulator